MKQIHLVFFVALFCSNIFFAQQADAMECPICCETYWWYWPVSFCNDRSHKACKNCQINHIKEQLHQGHDQIVCMFADQSATQSAHRQTDFVDEAIFLNELDEPTVAILLRNQRRSRAISIGYLPCSTDQCPGLVHRLEPDVPCKQCGKLYVDPVLYDGVRHCPLCHGPIEKISGCNTVKCGYCKKLINWEECKQARLPNKKSSEARCGICVLQ